MSEGRTVGPPARLHPPPPGPVTWLTPETGLTHLFCCLLARPRPLGDRDSATFASMIGSTAVRQPAIPSSQLLMNLNARTRLSLAQFLALLDHSALTLLLPKHGFAVEDLEDSFAPRSLPDLLRVAVVEAEPESLRSLLEEIARTLGAIRATQSPKYPYDERWHDLRLCLELDGYVLTDDASTKPPIASFLLSRSSPVPDLNAMISRQKLISPIYPTSRPSSGQ